MPNSCTAREILVHDSVRLFGLPAGSRFRPPCAASPKGLRHGHLSCSAWGRRPSGTSRCRDIAVDTPTPDVLMPSSRPPPRPRHGHHFMVLELLICPSLHLDLVDASGIFIFFKWGECEGLKRPLLSVRSCVTGICALQSVLRHMVYVHACKIANTRVYWHSILSNRPLQDIASAISARPANHAAQVCPGRARRWQKQS